MEFVHAVSYPTRLSASPIFELALDIAAFTRDDIHDKLASGLDRMAAVRRRLSPLTQEAVALAGTVHTWRSLLMLAHRCDVPDMDDVDASRAVAAFSAWLAGRGDALPGLAAPYLGAAWEEPLQAALAGDRRAVGHIMDGHAGNPVVCRNVRYLSETPPEALARHLRNLVLGWYEDIWGMRAGIWEALREDCRAKEAQVASMATAEFVRWATRGQEFLPPPGTETLWMVPQVAYQPFTIANYLPRCVVYYYPAAPEFLPGHAGAAAVQDMAARYKALGDLQRLRLLQCLREAPQSLADLTEALGGAKSNVHHHLTLLRTAGLVRVDRGVYALEERALGTVGDDLRMWLGFED